MNYFLEDRIMLVDSYGKRTEYKLISKSSYEYTLYNELDGSVTAVKLTAQYPLVPECRFYKDDVVYIKPMKWFSERGIDSIGSKMPLATKFTSSALSVSTLIYGLIGSEVHIFSLDYGDMSACVCSADNENILLWVPLYTLTRQDPTFLTSFKDFITNYLSSVSDQFLETKGQTVFLYNGEEISCDYIFLNNDGTIVMKSNDRAIFPSSSRDEVLMAGIAKIVNDLKH